MQLEKLSKKHQVFFEGDAFIVHQDKVHTYLGINTNFYYSVKSKGNHVQINLETTNKS